MNDVATDASEPPRSAADGMETVPPPVPRPRPGFPEPADYPVTLPFDLTEVRTVAAFCIRRLTGLQSSDLVELNDALVAYEANAGRGPGAAAAGASIIDKYNKLNDLLVDKSVNGASVYDSSTFSWGRQPIVWCGALLLLLGVASEIVSSDGSLLGQEIRSLPTVARYISPMAWGGLGAAVFLMKTLSDRVCDFAYEERRLNGTGARILIGMVFGLMVALAFPGLDTTLPAMATAFVAGLGAKAVYAALETLVNGIAAHVSGRGSGLGPSGAATPPQS